MEVRAGRETSLWSRACMRKLHSGPRMRYLVWSLMTREVVKAPVLDQGQMRMRLMIWHGIWRSWQLTIHHCRYFRQEETLLHLKGYNVRVYSSIIRVCQPCHSLRLYSAYLKCLACTSVTSANPSLIACSSSPSPYNLSLLLFSHPMYSASTPATTTMPQ
jgi:hypothetical protein